VPGGSIPGWARFISSSPKVHKSGYIPFFISERRQSAQALIAVVQEAFVNGVSTRKIERLARAMGIENISASQVWEFNKELDAQVEDFKARPSGRRVSLPLDRRPVSEGPC